MKKEYVLTYPHAGDYYLAFDNFFKRLGYTVATAPMTSQSSLNAGVKYSPSEACLPFKYTLGNIIEGIENNDVNVVAMVGGKTGMCRLSYFAPMYKKVLKDNQAQVDLFPFKLKKEMWDKIKSHFPEKTLFSFFQDCLALWLRLSLVEQIRETGLKTRPREKHQGDVDKLERRLKKKLAQIDAIKDLRALKKDITESFKKIPLDPKRKVIKIGLVGEFFLLIDQFSTMNMETFMGERGVEVVPSLSFTHFFKGSIKQIKWIHNIFPTETNKIWNLAKPYLDSAIGGHGRESTGQAALYAKKGFNGVIHLYPFTCMPEIVAAAILPKVGSDYNIPVLSLCMDEHTGAAGLQTRLEAFIDMIMRKK